MLEIGSLIDGKYKILNQIGKGGMSVVYLAINEKANKTWAVKEVRKDGVQNYEVVRQGLIVETDLLKKLKHPNLPSIIDVIDEDDTFLIVMDYIEGNSLETLLKEEGAQPQEKVISWGKQLCDVLGYLHRQKPPIIYRDMKPSNVMLKSDGTVTLIDFGTAREFKERSSRDDTVCLGTPGYAAPEQWGGSGQTDARTDIYCLGVMMFQLLTGESPHRLRPLRECCPSVSAGLDVIVCRCTRVRKEERYQSCAELLYALEHYQEQDRAYRKEQTAKVRHFAVWLSGAFLLGAAALMFLGLETHVRRSSYEAYLLAAGNSVEKEEEIENYVRAVQLKPSREEAWLGLLREGFLDDELLTEEESSRLRGILIQYTERGRTCESEFQENKKGYARFAYEAGLAYFYKYEDRENKKNAAAYLELAAESGKLEQNQEERAERLCLIAGYYSRIGKVDAAGDVFVSFRDYWEDLTDLSEGNLAEEDNERTALVMYMELVSQIVSRAWEFRDAGVGKEEMLEQLSQVEKHLDSDFDQRDSQMQLVLQKEIDELRQAAVQAERVVDSAFRQEGEEG